LLLITSSCLNSCNGFLPTNPSTIEVKQARVQTFAPRTSISTSTTIFSSSPSQIDEQIKLNNVKPRTGIAQALLNIALSSPLWKLVLVPQARQNIVKTAQANGIKWTDSYAWFYKQDGPWSDNKQNIQFQENMKVQYPEFYTKEFHAYEDGNLCWDAAIEQELASRAVGARNFPDYGSDGEDAFRRSFENALVSLGTDVPQDGVVVDLGCGTGTSTRRLASLFPQASKVIGMDLSPYFIEVGKYLLKHTPKGQSEGGPWVTTIENDNRVDLCVGNALSTGLSDNSVDVVNLSLVIHEMPMSVTCDVCEEALRILKPNGQLFISEMDFDSPAYAEQRANALLFSLLRATEPYLDEYADGFPEILKFLLQKFETVKITAATGRHYALVGTKGDGNTSSTNNENNSLIDSRFDSDGNYIVSDTHLKVWESKNE
jgi:ubiquinone/menaquinone biosynthesis C-methylase UbiE